MNLIHNMCSEVTLFKWLPHLWEANVFINSSCNRLTAHTSALKMSYVLSGGSILKKSDHILTGEEYVVLFVYSALT